MESLPKLYDLRVKRNTFTSDWYGPYALTDEDIPQLMYDVEVREHECDDPVNGGCGHMQEGLPAPY